MKRQGMYLGLTGFQLVAIILIDAFLSRFCLLVRTVLENQKFFVINHLLIEKRFSVVKIGIERGQQYGRAISAN